MAQPRERLLVGLCIFEAKKSIWQQLDGPGPTIPITIISLDCFKDSIRSESLKSPG